MLRHACFRLIVVTLLAVAGEWVLTTPLAAIDTSAAAAKASPELVAAISKEIGSTPEQAAGAAGTLFGLAKSRLKADDFAKISKAVPGMDLLLKAAPSAAASSGGGPADALSQLAGTVGSIPAVASKFSKLGLKPEMVPAVATTLTSFVTKSGGAGLGSLLAGALK
jgi:Protein of unknown function VcgC/VcgE (DUF2780)